MSTRKQSPLETVVALRHFYGALLEALDYLYPGYFAASGGPQKKDEPSRLPKAGILLGKLLDEVKLDPELREAIQSDYAHTATLLEGYKALPSEQKIAWLQEHEADRNRLLERTEEYSRLI